MSKPSLTIFTASTESEYDYYELFLDYCCNIMKDYNPVKMHITCNSLEEYSFIMATGQPDIKTDFFLIVQTDGFIVNPNQWTENFFRYDYIGAPWNNKNRNARKVGNGGFCLRSKKLNDALRDIYKKEKYKTYFPEDVFICVTKRRQLETQYGIKFAPYHIASKFSVEHETYNNQFGFHGKKMFNHGFDLIDMTYDQITKKYFRDQKIVVYTCVTGGYDTFDYPMENPEPNVDYVLFTDSKNLKPKGWIVKPIPSEFQYMDTIKQSKVVKILPHRFLSNYDVSIYIDGNVRLSKFTNLNSLVNHCDLDNHFLYVRHHPVRNCLYKEQKEITRLKIDTINDTLKQVTRYHDEGFPINYGLTENNILIRNHNNPDCQQLMEFWAREVVMGSFRDQLSFMYCVWKLNLKDSIGYLNPHIFSYSPTTNYCLFYKGGTHNRK